MKHTLTIIKDSAKSLTDLLKDFRPVFRISESDSIVPEIDKMVKERIEAGDSAKELITAVSDLDMSDEAWAHFLFTVGYWQGREE